MGSVQRVTPTYYVYTNFDPLYLINDQKIAFYQTSAVLNLPRPVNSNANDKRKGVYDRPGPDKNDSEPEEFEEDTDGLPIEHEKYGGQVSYDIPAFTASLKVDNPDKFLEDDFNPSKSTMPSVVAELSKQIDDANVDSYFKKVASLTKQYLKKQK